MPDMKSDLIYPEWQAEFQAAIVEVEPRALRRRIAAAESLIQRRLREIARDSDHPLERVAIDDALSALRILKQET